MKQKQLNFYRSIIKNRFVDKEERLKAARKLFQYEKKLALKRWTDNMRFIDLGEDGSYIR